jgi:hypothetical protein
VSCLTERVATRPPRTASPPRCRSTDAVDRLRWRALGLARDREPLRRGTPSRRARTARRRSRAPQHRAHSRPPRGRVSQVLTCRPRGAGALRRRRDVRRDSAGDRRRWCRGCADR